MPIDAFPIRYLGVPLHGKSLRCSELQGLVRKLTARVRGWEARKLSYARRLCLIQSILCSIVRFLSFIIFIPHNIKYNRCVEVICGLAMLRKNTTLLYEIWFVV